MHVCYLIDTLANGGAETMLLRLLRADGWGDIDHTVCYLGRSDHLRSAFVDAGVDVVDFGGVPTSRPRAALEAFRFFRRADIDVLHNHLPDSHVVGRVLGRLAGIDTVVSTHHNTAAGPAYRSLSGRLERATRFLDTAEVAVSEAVRESLDAGGHRKWRVINNAIDVEAFSSSVATADASEVRERYGLDSPVFLNVGRYVEQKAQENLVAAMDAAGDSLPEATLLLVGWGPREAELKREVSERGLEDRVFVTGRVPEVYPYYAAADAFVLSSRHEGLGIVLLEALAAGLPLVVTDIPGAPDVVEDAGIVVPPGDSAALADAMVRVSDGEVAGRLAAESKARASEFDIRTAVARHRDLYLELVGGDTAESQEA